MGLAHLERRSCPWWPRPAPMPSPQVTGPLTGKAPFVDVGAADAGGLTDKPPDEVEEASAMPTEMLNTPKIVVVKVRTGRQNAVLGFISSLFHLPSGLADGLALKEFALRISAIRPRGHGRPQTGPPIRLEPDSACLSVTNVPIFTTDCRRSLVWRRRRKAETSSEVPMENR